MHTPPMFKAVKFLAACCLLTSFGCMDSEGQDIQYQIQIGNFKTDSVRFEQSGGGEIIFTVTRDPANLKVDVTRWRYQDTLISCRVAPEAMGPEHAANVEGLFDGTTNISGVIPQETAISGTWQSAYVKKSDQWIRIANPSVLMAVGAVKMVLDTTVLKPTGLPGM